MTIGEKLREARTRAGLTQARLAEKLSVSRQAVTKWEADGGVPDVENLKRIACLLRVSVDYLLDGGGRMDRVVIREDVDLGRYGRGRKKVKKDRAVREKYPEADVYTLIARRRPLKSERAVDRALGLFTAAAAGIPLLGIPELLNGLKDLDKEFYLVVSGGRQLLVLVSDEFMESRELARTAPEAANARFTIGDTEFRNCGKILYG